MSRSSPSIGPDHHLPRAAPSGSIPLAAPTTTRTSVSAGIRLRTLGRAEIVEIGPDGAERVLSRAGKPVALLALLAAAPGRSATRDRLVAMFWPERPTERGRHALRQQLVNLRKLVGSDAVKTTDEDVTVDASFTDDRSVLLAAARAGDVDGVLAAYGGEFLPDMSAAGGVEFEHWCDAERRMLTRLFVRTAVERIPLLVRAGAGDEAVRLAARVRTAIPEDELGWRILIKTLVGTGRLLDARIEVETLEALRASDHGDLEPATAALVRRVRSSVPATPVQTVGTTGATPPFVGRERVISRLLAQWQRARTGRAEIATVTAAAGIGKTRVLEELDRRVRADGGGVVRVAAHLGERTMPYALVSELVLRVGQLPGAGGIAPVTASIAVGLAPSLSSHYAAAAPERPHATEAGRIVQALVELLRCVADERPVLLAIDDWHWVDPESSRVVAGLLRRLGDVPVLVVTASRTAVSLDESAGEATMLEPLTLAETEELLAGLGPLPGEHAEEFVASMHEGSDGSPLLLLHLIRHAREHGWIGCDEGWQVRDLTALRRAARSGGALESRIGELPPECLLVLRLVALDGVPIDHVVLGHAADIDGAALEPIIQELEGRGFVERALGGWRTAHDEIGRAAVPVPPDDEATRALRRRLGEAYALAAAEDELLWRRAAVHLVAGGWEDRLVSLLRAWIGRQRLRGTEIERRHLLLLLGPEVADGLVRLAVQRRSPRARWLLATAAGALACAAAVGLFALAGGLGAGGATHMVLENEPVLFSAEELPVPIGVALIGADGRVADVTGDSVRVTAIDGGRVVRGGSAPVIDGRARFDDLVVEGSRTFRLKFSLPGLPPLLSDTLLLGTEDAASTLRLAGGGLAGAALSVSMPTVRIAPGQRIAGTLDLRYTSAWAAANVVLALARTWEDGAGGCRRVTSFVTPARDLMHRVALDEPGPSVPGSYYLVAAFHAEDSAEDICSGTNWTYGRQVWGDGNDLSQWGDAQARQANARGQVTNGFLTRDAAGRELRSTYTVPAVMIRVIVSPNGP